MSDFREIYKLDFYKILKINNYLFLMDLIKINFNKFKTI